MKSIDLLFTLDSFEHKACDVSVCGVQSQYASPHINLACKREGGGRKEILVISDRAVSSSGLCVYRGQAGCCLYYLMDLRWWSGRDEADRSLCQTGMV